MHTHTQLHTHTCDELGSSLPSSFQENTLRLSFNWNATGWASENIKIAQKGIILHKCYLCKLVERKEAQSTKLHLLQWSSRPFPQNPFL